VAGAPTVLIMAAGEGTRMRSSTPKMLHPICGRPMIAWPVRAAQEARAGRVCVIVSAERDLSDALPDDVEVVVQPEADGTGGAVRAAVDAIRESDEVLVVPGDHPLISPEAFSRLIVARREAEAAATVVTIELEDPGSYGRVVRDASGDVERIVEAKEGSSDATSEQLAIKEVSSVTFAFEAAALAYALERITNDNAQGEYYIGDVLAVMRGAGLRVTAHRDPDPNVSLGVNSRADLAAAEREARALINRRHMEAGVTLVDPAATWIDADVELAPDVRVEPGCALHGRTAVAEGATIGPLTTAIDAIVGAGAAVVRSHLAGCEVSERCTIGPFSHLRPGTWIGAGAKVGAFVEIKNSVVGPGAKVPHLSYVGDADVGDEANVGAGAITANYDGFEKHRTKIGQGARIAVHTSLVAPVSVGEEAYTGAGAVIRKDVPPGALGISKGEQRNIEGYAKRRSEQVEERDAMSDAEGDEG
jgi:bifunctional UDP-N-acetylglucosamine pyrophosphorylase / glucosamine-1-phosphate N-acetyltransferase